MASGIYKITNKINGKFYIGSAVNCFQRWYKKYNNHLESAFKKYGRENFTFEILEEVEDKSKLLEREQIYLDTMKPYIPDIGYNLCETAGSRIGQKASDETRKKLSEARKKRITKPETCQKISDSLKGREIEWADKIAEANTGENHYNFGGTLTDEHKEKISKSLLGINRSEETKKKMSEAKKGRKFSEEHKQRLSEAAKNRKRKTDGNK